MFTSKFASRHNGVHFFDISTSKSGPDIGVFCTFWVRNVLRATTACNFSCPIWSDDSAPAAFASLLFGPPEPQNIGKTVFHDFSIFSRTCIFFRLTLSLLWSSFFLSSVLFSSLLCLFPPLLFHLSILSEVWLLNKLLRTITAIIEGSLEVKLPTIWTDEKQSRGEAERRERLEERRVEEKE